MFSRASVIQFTGGLPPGEVCIQWGLPLGVRSLPPEGFTSRGLLREVGQTPTPRSTNRRSAERGRGWADPPDTRDTTGYGQQVGRTHPTGMVSCNDIIVSLLTKPSFQFLKLGICVKLLDGDIHVLIGDGLANFTTWWLQAT